MLHCVGMELTSLDGICLNEGGCILPLLSSNIEDDDLEEKEQEEQEELSSNSII